MDSNIIAALIGGIFTLAAVFLTHYLQRDASNAKADALRETARPLERVETGDLNTPQPTTPRGRLERAFNGVVLYGVSVFIIWIVFCSFTWAFILLNRGSGFFLMFLSIGVFGIWCQYQVIKDR